jgi:hypothetical protein
VPNGHLQAFDAVVQALRSVRISAKAYVRPPAELPQRWASGHAADDLGNKWVRPVGDRLIPLEPGNPWAHMLYAVTHITHLPHNSHNVQMHSHGVLRDVADYMVAQGTGLADDGAARRQMMRTAEHMLRPFAEWIVASVMTKEAQHVSSHVKIPLFCAWIGEVVVDIVVGEAAYGVVERYEAKILAAELILCGREAPLAYSCEAGEGRTPLSERTAAQTCELLRTLLSSRLRHRPWR